MSIGFEQAAYTVIEGGNVTVCATVMNGTLSMDIVLTVDVLPGNASGLGSGELNCVVYLFCECTETLLTCS